MDTDAVTATTLPAALASEGALAVEPDGTQKRTRDSSEPQEPTPAGAPPTKKSKPNVPAPLGASIVQSLSDRKTELESKLREVTESLAKINESIEQISRQASPFNASEPLPLASTPAKPKAKSRAKTSRSKSSRTSTPRKSSVEQSPDTPRPKRQRKKSTVLREAEETGVVLPPALESCKSVLNAIARHKYSHPFMAPVDPVALNIADYHTVIKHPMDFGTIRKKLFAGKYENVADFSADAYLVFSNACTYNPPGTDVYIMAETLRTFFAKKIQAVEERELRLKQKDSGEIQELRKSVNNIKEELHQIRESKGGTSRSRSRANDNTPMTKTEMRKLSSAVNSLSNKQMGSIIAIIKDSMPSLSGEGEIEIDLNTLDTSTLRKLEAFVASASEKKRPRKKSGSVSLESQRELARRSQEGTEKEIESVQRQIELLRDPHQPVRPAPVHTQEEQEVKVDESGSSESESGTSSESESESESDSGSDQ